MEAVCTDLGSFPENSGPRARKHAAPPLLTMKIQPRAYPLPKFRHLGTGST